MPLQALDAWLGVLAFSGQIFFDFAGYSTCAIGIALCLGFTLPNNFLFPYAAIGFSDFWRRWHITLSSWLRDYLYIPLGGNRSGEARTYINLMITMLLGGLWHGASWTFVVWGALHGVYLCVEKVCKDKLAKMPGRLTAPVMPGPAVAQASVLAGLLKGRKVSNFFLALLTFFLVNVTWVFFRSPDFATAWRLLYSMFGQITEGAALLSGLDVIKVTVIISLMVLTHWLMRNTNVLAVAKKMPWWIVGGAWAFMLILLILSQESSSSFIYFQF